MEHEPERSKRDFQKEEFRYLTDSIHRLVDEQFKLERYALIGSVGTYAWLLTKTQTATEFAPLTKYVFWLPPALIAFSMMRSVSLLFTLEGTYAYIRELEAQFLGARGWQGFVVERRKKSLGAWSFRVSLTVFWAVLFVITICLAWRLAPLWTSK